GVAGNGRERGRSSRPGRGHWDCPRAREAAMVAEVPPDVVTGAIAERASDGACRRSPRLTTNSSSRQTPRFFRVVSVLVSSRPSTTGTVARNTRNPGDPYRATLETLSNNAP